MFRHYCFMFGLPSNHHHHHSQTHRITSLSRSRAHVERLKLIRVYERRVKPGAECRGEIATYAWPGSVSKFIPRWIVSFDFLVVPEGRCVCRFTAILAWKYS